jgi:hypothetical protein
MAFSGAVKIADSFDDFLAPSQKCIKPLMDPVVAPGAAAEGTGTAVKGTRVTFLLDFCGCTRISPSLQSRSVSIDAQNKGTVVKVELDLESPGGGHFDQIRMDSTKKSATVSLNDCLACRLVLSFRGTRILIPRAPRRFLNDQLAPH